MPSIAEIAVKFKKDGVDETARTLNACKKKSKYRYISRSHTISTEMET